MITQQILKQHFIYFKTTGLFYSKATGKTVGCKRFYNSNLIYLAVYNKRLGIETYVHRLAFLYVTGSIPPEVDHINGDGTDNRWGNLRAANKHINMRNKTKHKNNTSGVAGVHYRKREKKWVARIGAGKGGKKISLGYFDNFDDAVKARRAAEQVLGYTPRD